MTKSVDPIPSSLEKIREGLDPAFSYMIFEKPAGSGIGVQFDEVFAILERLHLSVRQREVFLDEARRKMLLVVKFDPGRADEIMQEFMSAGLPGDIAFFAYGSSVIS